MPSDTGAIALPPLYHISAVVKDVDKTIEFLSSIWGLGPWHISEPTAHEGKMMAGPPFRIKLAWANLGPTRLELVQPLEGNAVWSQFLKTKGEGLHHIAFSVSNWEEVVSKIQQHEGVMVAGATNEDGTRWGYFDTKPGGIVVEFEEKIE